jgi:hypothetical protein
VSGCPACGARRLKRASFAANLKVALHPRSGKRLYACTKCDWTGWKPQLRAAHGSGRVSRRDRQAVLFLAAAFVVLLIVAIVLFRNIEPSGPRAIEGPGPAGALDLRGSTARV